MSSDWKDILAGLSSAVPSDRSDDGTASMRTVDEAAKKPRSVTLFYESKGRAGKPATILADFEGVDDADISELASELKRALGTGGSCRGGEILIQGDRRPQLRKILTARGFRVKG